jgi:hypothetical protein
MNYYFIGPKRDLDEDKLKDSIKSEEDSSSDDEEKEKKKRK